MAEEILSNPVPSTSSALPIEDTHVESTCPFDDPVERRKCLVQYIRIRKQRAENEIAKRNALRKQKKDAKATLQSARDTLKGNEEEVLRCEQRLQELNRMRHELLVSYKSVVNKETERKRQREAVAEEVRRNEEQKRLKQQSAAAAAQLLGIDTMLLQQQLKNTPLLNVFASNPGVNNRVAQLMSSSGANLTISSAPGNSTASSTANLSPSPAATTPQPQHCLTPIQQQKLTAVAAEATFQQQQNSTAATLNFLRQQYALSASGQPSQSTLDSLRQLQQLNTPSMKNASPSPFSLVAQQPQPSVQRSSTSTTALQQAMANAGISQEVLYQTFLANLTSVAKTD